MYHIHCIFIWALYPAEYPRGGANQQWIEGYFVALCKRNVGDTLFAIADSTRKGQIWGPLIMQ